MKHFIFEKYRNTYLYYRIIFLFDIVVSTIASAIAIVCLRYFTDTSPIIGLFTIKYAGLAACSTILVGFCSHIYRNTIRHMGLHDVFKLTVAICLKELIILLVFAGLGYLNVKQLGILFLDFMLTVIFIIGYRVTIVMLFKAYIDYTSDNDKREKILIFGVKTKATSLITQLSNSVSYSVEGLISNNPNDNGNHLLNKTIWYFDQYKDFGAFAKSNGIVSILFAHESDARAEMDGLVKYCYQIGVKVLIAPSVNEMKNGMTGYDKVREIKIEDLLSRDEITLNRDDIQNTFQGKVILITGAAGSIGSELVRQLSAFNIKKIILFDNAETPLHSLRLELQENFKNLDFIPIIGDVRHKEHLDLVFRKYHPQIVFHAAAYKHVPLMEENPHEAVMVNIVGSRNIADKCIEYNVEKMVMISTDKAVNPTNIMGCTKRLAEIYVQSLGLAIEHGKVAGQTKFVTTRFGNVLGSNGSVIPRFREQIEKGGPVTVTHPDINRFFMTIPEACRLVMEAVSLPYHNKIFVFDMGRPVKIDTLARNMIALSGLKPDVDIKIVYTGLRPGEKLFEEVLADEEHTTPTTHDRIKIAAVRDYDYEEAGHYYTELESLATDYKDSAVLVKLMKEIVPEFKSENSWFKELDNNQK